MRDQPSAMFARAIIESIECCYESSLASFKACYKGKLRRFEIFNIILGKIKKLSW
ncbi:hypothetical protein D3C84_328820 [compost metagenome]